MINENLISNTYYLEQFHSSQQRLLSCGNNIMFHFALLTLDNKSQDLAYFIKLDNKPSMDFENKTYDEIISATEYEVLKKAKDKYKTTRNIAKALTSIVLTQVAILDEFSSNINRIKMCGVPQYRTPRTSLQPITARFCERRTLFCAAPSGRLFLP